MRRCCICPSCREYCSACVYVSGGKSIRIVSSKSACVLVRSSFPPSFRALLQISQLQNNAGQPSAAAVPKYCIFITSSFPTGYLRQAVIDSGRFIPGLPLSGFLFFIFRNTWKLFKIIS